MIVNISIGFHGVFAYLRIAYVLHDFQLSFTISLLWCLRPDRNVHRGSL